MRGVFVQSMKEIAEAFGKERVVKLQDFFEKEVYEHLFKEMQKGKKVWVPDMHRYELLSVRLSAFDASFRKWLEGVLGKKVKDWEISVRRFGAGDYTVVHDSVIEGGIRFFLFVSGEWDSAFGGSVVLRGERPVIFPVEGNCFVLIDSEERGFVQYVNHHVGKEKFVLVEGIVV